MRGAVDRLTLLTVLVVPLACAADDGVPSGATTSGASEGSSGRPPDSVMTFGAVEDSGTGSGGSVTDGGSASTGTTGRLAADSSDGAGDSGSDVDTGIVGTTGGGLVACDDVLLQETFNRTGLDRSPDWDIELLGKPTTEVVAGTFVMDFSANHGLTATSTQPVTGFGAVAVEIVAGPTDSPGVIWLGLIESDNEAYIDVAHGDLRAVYRPAGDIQYQVLDSMPYDEDAHRYIAMRFNADDTMARLQTSPDGQTWSDAFSMDVSTLQIANARAVFGAGAVGGAESLLAAIDNLIVCADP